MQQTASIIIPIGPNETRYPRCISQFSELDRTEFEIIVIAPHNHRIHSEKIPEIKIIKSSNFSRAHQQNLGAYEATGRYLVFCHADTVIPARSLQKLKSFMAIGSNCVGYFYIQFDGKRRMVLNTIGCWFRSRLIGLPFGDQVFVVKKVVFESVGMFSENILYGEDHDFIWRCHLRGVLVRPVGAWITTSSEKYVHYGWLSLTLRYQYLTWKQAWPYFWKCLRKRVKFFQKRMIGPR